MGTAWLKLPQSNAISCNFSGDGSTANTQVKLHSSKGKVVIVVDETGLIFVLDSQRVWTWQFCSHS